MTAPTAVHLDTFFIINVPQGLPVHLNEVIHDSVKWARAGSGAADYGVFFLAEALIATTV